MEQVAPPVATPGGAIANAIANVMKGAKAVEKRGENKFHGYRYATAADILHTIQPLMAQEGLVVMQNEVSSQFLMGETVLAVTFDFTLAHKSGEVWPEKIRRTGMCAAKNQKGGFDDKAFNKAVTTAHKYFLLTLFEIPTGDYAEADEDGDIPPQAHRQGPQQIAPEEPKEAPQYKLSAAQDMVNSVKKRTTPAALKRLEEGPKWKEYYATLNGEDKVWVDSVLAAQREAVADPTSMPDEPLLEQRQPARREPEPAPPHTPGRLSQAAMRTMQNSPSRPVQQKALLDDDIPF